MSPKNEKRIRAYQRRLDGQFPDTHIDVRPDLSGGVVVSWTDGPTVEQVRAQAKSLDLTVTFSRAPSPLTLAKIVTCKWAKDGAPGNVLTEVWEFDLQIVPAELEELAALFLTAAQYRQPDGWDFLELYSLKRACVFALVETVTTYGAAIATAAGIDPKRGATSL
jgi:hypothetical protein